MTVESDPPGSRIELSSTIDASDSVGQSRLDSMVGSGLQPLQVFERSFDSTVTCPELLAKLYCECFWVKQCYGRPRQ